MCRHFIHLKMRIFYWKWVMIYILANKLSILTLSQAADNVWPTYIVNKELPMYTAINIWME